VSQRDLPILKIVAPYRKHHIADAAVQIKLCGIRSIMMVGQLLIPMIMK
jgi:hypothetical protein